MGLRAIGAAGAILLGILPLWRDTHHAAPDPVFSVRNAAPPASTGDAKDHMEELIDPNQGTAVAHVASLCELTGGRLGAAWYGGTREGHQDVAIYFSTKESKDAGGWSPPQAVVTRESAARELQRFVRKVGNAVVFADAHSGLWLVYVSVAAGGWSGSSLNVKRSFDQGRTWTPSQRLTLSPFCNISELVKDKPMMLEDGNWVLPVYHEAVGKFPELLWLRDAAGEILESKSRLFGGRTAFQPSVVPLGGGDALALCRPADGSRTIMMSRTTDSGRHWTEPRSIGLPNPDSGLDALRLSDGRLLMAFNDSPKGRENLKLAISSDNGASWKRVVTLEDEPGGEFSYPFLLQTSDGRVHLAYTWKRKGIKHHAFSVAWLDSHDTAAAP